MIVRNRVQREFRSLDPGITFYFSGRDTDTNLFMRVIIPSTQGYFAVNLHNGAVRELNPEVPIKIVDAEVLVGRE